MKLLFLIILFIVFGGGMIILSLLKGISQMIFGKSAQTSSRYTSNTNRSANYNERTNNGDTSKKVFAKNEGEYVNYEEIKDS